MRCTKGGISSITDWSSFNSPPSLIHTPHSAMRKRYLAGRQRSRARAAAVRSRCWLPAASSSPALPHGIGQLDDVHRKTFLIMSWPLRRHIWASQYPLDQRIDVDRRVARHGRFPRALAPEGSGIRRAMGPPDGVGRCRGLRRRGRPGSDAPRRRWSRRDKDRSGAAAGLGSGIALTAQGPAEHVQAALRVALQQQPEPCDPLPRRPSRVAAIFTTIGRSASSSGTGQPAKAAKACPTPSCRSSGSPGRDRPAPLPGNLVCPRPRCHSWPIFKPTAQSSVNSRSVRRLY